MLGVTPEPCLRYSRADYLRKLVRLETSNMQIIHRSVGEPAEGSLTRIHVSTNENLFSRLPVQRMNWNQFEGLMGPQGRPSWYTYVNRNVCVDNCIFVTGYFLSL